MKTPDHILCIGLGLANACLISSLRRRGYQGRISIIEKSSSPDKDRRWCTWKPLPAPLNQIDSTQWRRWTLQSGVAPLALESDDQAYVEVKSRDFWKHQLERLNQDPLVSIHYNVHLDEHIDCTKLPLGSAKPIDLVIDSRPVEFGKNQYQQQFAGRVIQTAEPVFDPSTAQLMHFTEETDRIAFLYCLPYSTTSALVEYTTFEFGQFSAEHHFERLASLLDQNFNLQKGRYSILSSEAASLPMGTYDHPKPTEGHWPIGIRGGAIRGSSGYALLTICKQVERYAASIVRGMPHPIRPPAAEYFTKCFDRVFIRAIRRHPTLGRDCLLACAHKLSSRQFIELMRGELSIRSTLKVVSAMPTGAFIKALIIS